MHTHKVFTVAELPDHEIIVSDPDQDGTMKLAVRENGIVTAEATLPSGREMASFVVGMFQGIAYQRRRDHANLVS